ncbi:unnamed protein product [Urochloa decumbens]|uniref:Uncharacterized protein n=1 Tax=Urochloa decumbens TaxID=240449 RepID=A0ABC9CTI0_9POAL
MQAMDLKEGRQASRSLTCSTMPPRRVAFAVDTYAAAADAGPPQPQTATCCTALQRGFAPDSRVQARYAPVRTPGSAALMPVDEDADHQPHSAKDGVGGVGGEEMVAAAAAAPAPAPPRSAMKKAMRKWNSSVEEVAVSQLAETPRLRRSGGMRRDWSFENLRGGNNAA